MAQIEALGGGEQRQPIMSGHRPKVKQRGDSSGVAEFLFGSATRTPRTYAGSCASLLRSVSEGAGAPLVQIGPRLTDASGPPPVHASCRSDGPQTTRRSFRSDSRSRPYPRTDMCMDGTTIARMVARITVGALLALLPLSFALLAVAFAPPTRIEIAGQWVSLKPVIGQDTSRLLDGALVSPEHAHLHLISKDVGLDVDADWNRLIPRDKRTRGYLADLWNDPVPEIARIQDTARRHVAICAGVGFAFGTALVASSWLARSSDVAAWLPTRRGTRLWYGATTAGSGAGSPWRGQRRSWVCTASRSPSISTRITTMWSAARSSPAPLWKAWRSTA